MDILATLGLSQRRESESNKEHSFPTRTRAQHGHEQLWRGRHGLEVKLLYRSGSGEANGAAVALGRVPMEPLYVAGLARGAVLVLVSHFTKYRVMQRGESRGEERRRPEMGLRGEREERRAIRQIGIGQTSQQRTI